MAFDQQGNYIPDLPANDQRSWLDKLTGIKPPVVGNDPYARARQQQLAEQRGQPTIPELTRQNAAEFEHAGGDYAQMPSFLAAQAANRTQATQQAGMMNANPEQTALVQALRARGADRQLGQSNAWETPENLQSSAVPQ